MCAMPVVLRHSASLLNLVIRAKQATSGHVRVAVRLGMEMVVTVTVED